MDNATTSDSLPAPTEESKQEFPALQEPAPAEASSAPPSWDDVKANPKFAATSPEERLITFSRWHDDAYNHATKQPFWQDKTQQDMFNNKAAQIQTELSHEAGGLSPDQARVKVATDAVNTAHNNAAAAESERPGHEIERDALAPLHPDIRKAYYENKAQPATQESYLTSMIAAPSRAIHSITGRGAQILSDALKTVGSTIGEGTRIPALASPFNTAGDALADVADRLQKMGSEHGTTDPIALTLDKVYPGSSIATIYGGVSQGTAAALQQFTASENVPFLLTGGAGAKTLMGVFTALGLKQLPDLYKQFNATTDPREKIAIATQGIVGVAAPALGLKGEPGIKADAYVELHNHLTQMPTSMLQAALKDPKVIPDLKASIQDALKAQRSTQNFGVPVGIEHPVEHPVVKAAQEADAPKTAAEVAPLVEPEKPAAPAPAAPEIHIRDGKLVAPPGTTHAQFADFWRAIPADRKTPELVADIKAELKKTAKSAPETIVGPSLAGEVGEAGATHADLLTRSMEGPYAGVALERFQDPTGHTFRTSRGRDVDRREAFRLAREEQERTGRQVLQPGVLENADENHGLQSHELAPALEGKAAAATRGIPEWMQGEEKLPTEREIYRGTGLTPEQRELKNKAGTELAHKKAIDQGFVDTHGDLHKMTDSATAKKIGPEIAKELLKAYPPEKLPAGATETLTKHSETGIKYPIAEVPTDRTDLKTGKPILETRAKYTNNSLQTAAALDDGKELKIPSELVDAGKVNPAVNYEYDPKTATYNVTGVRTKYGFVEKPGDLADLYNERAIANRQKAPTLVHGEKAIAAAEGGLARETGAEDIHEPERLGQAIGAGEEIPQGNEERAMFAHLMDEADRLGIDPSTITDLHDPTPPEDLGAKMAVRAWRKSTPEDITDHLTDLRDAGVWREDGKMSPDPIGAYLRSKMKQGNKFPSILAREILDSKLRTGDINFEVINNPEASWSGYWIPKDSKEGEKLGFTRNTIRLNIAFTEESTESTMLHEIIHSVIEPVLHDPARMTPEITKIWANIKNLHETANKYVFQQIFDREPTPEEYKNFVKAQKTRKQVGGFKPAEMSALQFVGDPSELPTRALTDSRAQEILTSCPPDPRVPNPKGIFKNLFDQVMAALKAIWPSKQPLPDNLFNQLVDQTLAFFQEARKGEEAQPRAGPAKAAEAGSIEEAAHEAPETLKAPRGATRVRVTDHNGRVSVVLAKDMDTLKDAGPFDKVEAGTMSKGKFLPMPEPVTIKPPKPAPAALEAKASKGESKKVTGFDWDKLAAEIAGPERADQEPLGSGWLGKNGEHLPAVGDMEHATQAESWLAQNAPNELPAALKTGLHNYMFKKGFIRIVGGGGDTLYIEGNPTTTQLRILKDEAAAQGVDLAHDVLENGKVKSKILFSPSEKMATATGAQQGDGGKIVEIVKAGGISHELELKPNATVDQLNLLSEKMDSLPLAAADKAKMQEQINTAKQTLKPGITVSVPVKGVTKQIVIGYDSGATIANVRGRQARNSVAIDFGDPVKPTEQALKDREASPFVQEAGGDIKELDRDLNRVANSKDKDLAAQYTPIVQYAIDNFARLQPKLEGFQKKMAEQLEREKAVGLPVGELDRYVTRILEQPENQGAVVASGTGKYFIKGRTFEKLSDAIAEGFIPKEFKRGAAPTDIAELAGKRIEAGERLVQMKLLEEELKKMAAPNGKPIISTPESHQTLMGKTETRTPAGYESVHVGGGRNLIVHNEVAPVFKALYGDSSVPDWVAASTGFVKRNTLVFDTYHVGRIMFKELAYSKGMERFGWNKGLSILEYTDEDIAKMLENGDINRASAEYAKENRPVAEGLLKNGLNVGKISDNLFAELAYVIPGLERFNPWVFQKLSRGAMLQTAIENFQRNMKRFPERGEEGNLRQTAIESNEVFGNLQNQGIFKNKTFQDTARTVFLAPNWAESQLKAEVRGYAQLGKVPLDLVRGKLRIGTVAQGQLTAVFGMLAAFQVANYATTGHSTFENEEGHKLEMWIPGGKRGFYFNPFTIGAEYAYMATRYFSQHMDPLDIVTQILSNKLQPVARGVKDLATGRDWSNKPYLSAKDRIRGAIVDTIPLPIGASAVLEKDPRQTLGYRVTRQPGSWEKQGLQSIGAKVYAAPSPRTQMFQLAHSFRDDKGYTDMAGEYTELRRALDNDQLDNAKSEIRMLAQRGHTPEEIRMAVGITKSGTIKPERFTGTVPHETDFKRSLTPEQKQLYAAAQKDHKENAMKLRKILPEMKHELAEVFKTNEYKKTH